MTYHQHPVVSSPMSFIGSSERIWRLANRVPLLFKFFTIPFALVVIPTMWMVVLLWYCAFAALWMFVIPYRLVRRGQRRRHVG